MKSHSPCIVVQTARVLLSTLTIDLTAEQVGTAADNGIKEFMLASAGALNSATTLTFNHKLTVLKLTLTLPEPSATKADKPTTTATFICVPNGQRKGLR